MNLPINTLLQGGKYKIVRFISAGGFGCTYEVVTQSGESLALKELFVKSMSVRDEETLSIGAFSNNSSPLLEKLKKKFMEEAYSLKFMRHPNIVRVYDVFEENGTAYYAMEYVKGLSLHDLIKQQGRLTEEKTIKYMKQVASALKYVHSQNRLHLDIKPGNIMIDEDDKAYLIDFGTSKQYEEESGENTSSMLGYTPGFAPIEQLGNNLKNFSPATDIYALGATMYYCVVGEKPLGPTEILNDSKAFKIPQYLSERVRKTIERSMKVVRDERLQNIDAFLETLDGTQKTHSTPPSEPESSSGASKLLGGIIIGVVLMVIILGVYLFLHQQPKEIKVEGEEKTAAVDVETVEAEEVKEVRTMVPVKKNYPEDGILDGEYDFSGTIDKYPIEMHLEIMDNYVSGTYYYKKNGANAKLFLEGTNYDGELDIVETNKSGKPTGHFYGNLRKDVFSGTFVTYQGKEMSFYLRATHFFRGY